VTQLFGIGELIRQLSDEFPDLTVSKVRFLESQGLITPQRAKSGYRKFSAADADRLRYTLRSQRDHFLPLKVIAEHLDAIERGLQPPELTDPAPRTPTHTEELLRADLLVTRAELRKESGLSEQQVDEALEQGLLAQDPQGLHPASDVAAAQAIAALASVGLTPRHLRAARLAADRVCGVIDQAVQSTENDPAKRVVAATAIGEAAGRLNAALLARHIESKYGSGVQRGS